MSNQRYDVAWTPAVVVLLQHTSRPLSQEEKGTLNLVFCVGEMFCGIGGRHDVGSKERVHQLYRYAYSRPLFKSSNLNSKTFHVHNDHFCLWHSTVPHAHVTFHFWLGGMRRTFLSASPPRSRTPRQRRRLVDLSWDR